MNANEIAEQLENISWLQGDGKVKPFQHYANFVRQQQAEIEALKAKTLTDDEIQEIAHGFGAIGWMGEETYEFARAILRKAQEK
jgi:hypothetical protein